MGSSCVVRFNGLRVAVWRLGLLAVCGAAAPARATDVTWINSAGGSFGDEANWTPDLLFSSDVPGTNDIAHFGLTTSGFNPKTYTVTFATDPTNLRLIVEDDRVTFDLNGHTYRATSPIAVVLGTFSGRLGRLVVTDGLLSTPLQADIEIGSVAGSTGTLEVSTGGLVLGSPEIIVGVNGGGTLNVTNNGDIIADAVTLGKNAGSVGIATITGGGSSLLASDLVVGSSGNGTLNVNSSGDVDVSSNAWIGNQVGSTGTANVDGANSLWDISGSLVVGNFGTGTLNITDGGRVENSFSYIGREQFSTGTVTVGGTGSNWTVRAELGVGVSNNFTLNGGAGTLIIQPGGTVDVASTIKLGDGGAVSLEGGTLSANSIDFLGAIKQFDWTSGTLHVGVYDGSLTVPNGGVLAPGRNGAGLTAIAQQYRSLAGSTTQIEIGGTAQNGTTTDFISVGSSALLSGGNLQLALINGFIPSPAATFTIVDVVGGSVSGSFANIASGQRLATSDGLGSFLVHYGTSSTFDPTQVVLSSFLAVALPGDYNQNGTVDAADYVVWRNNLGSGTSLPNDDTSGVGPDDYTRWRTHFGQTAGSGSGAITNAAIPEPAPLVMLLAGMLAMCPRRRVIFP